MYSLSRCRNYAWLWLFTCVVNVLVFFIVFHHISPKGIPTSSTAQEQKFKIYVYPTNSEFNYDIVPVAAQHISKSILSENGIGLPLPNSDFAFNTDQFALEQYFHYRILHSTYITNNTEEADIFYVPFYANMAHLAGSNYRHYYKDFWNWMKNSSLFQKFPKQHLVVFGGCEQFATDFMMASKLYKNITVVMLERSAKKDIRNPKAVINSNVVVAPYPSHIHFEPEKQYMPDYAKKDVLISSSWKSRYPIRKLLAGLCNASSDCVHMETIPFYNRSYVFDITSRSVFCLSPPGDSSTRKAFWDAITLGCINVIYENDIKYPFDDLIDYKNLTVYIPNNRVNDTIKILKAIPRDKIIAKQNYIEKHKEKFQYTVVPNYTSPVYTNDAFDMILSEVYQRLNLTQKV
eukprot:Phypoly_transcript_10621.p1 GENE.Phypoly_transcript_10621~~Phypoly_transcript_10621.p1  ORF type:complete len:404 (+),score=34.14 Phypoly_transcript_10621:33-1244(+)